MANRAHHRAMQQFPTIPTHPDNFRNTQSKLYQFREIQKKSNDLLNKKVKILHYKWMYVEMPKWMSVKRSY